VKERAYGQDIVCTKICGRIIESRFCVVILDEVDRDGVNIANPNVYYEYGLMTALRKHVIPLQRDGMSLAFNIQSQDTVKYNARNMADELERAIRDAIAQTEPGHHRGETDVPVGTRGIRRRLELAGYVAAERSDPRVRLLKIRSLLRSSPTPAATSSWQRWTTHRTSLTTWMTCRYSCTA